MQFIELFHILRLKDEAFPESLVNEIDGNENRGTFEGSDAENFDNMGKEEQKYFKTAYWVYDKKTNRQWPFQIIADVKVTANIYSISTPYTVWLKLQWDMTQPAKY